MVAKKIEKNIINGFYNIKNCLDRDNQKISTRYAINDISKAYNISKDNIRYFIGNEILREKNRGMRVEEIATEYNISKSTVYRYMKLYRYMKNSTTKNSELEEKVQIPQKQSSFSKPSFSKRAKKALIGLGVGILLTGGIFSSGFKAGINYCKKHLYNPTPIVNTYNEKKIKKYEEKKAPSHKPIYQNKTYAKLESKVLKIEEEKPAEIEVAASEYKLSSSNLESPKLTFDAGLKQETQQETQIPTHLEEKTIPETSTETKIYVPENKDIVLSNLSQNNLEKILTLTCNPNAQPSKNPDIVYFIGNMFLGSSSIRANIREMIRTEYEQMIAIISEIGKLGLPIYLYEHKGLKFLDLPNNIEGNPGYKGFLPSRFKKSTNEETTYLIGIVNDEGSSLILKNKPLIIPAKQITAEEALQIIYDAKKDRYVPRAEEIPGKKHVVDGFGLYNRGYNNLYILNEETSKFGCPWRKRTGRAFLIAPLQAAGAAIGAGGAGGIAGVAPGVIGGGM